MTAPIEWGDEDEQPEARSCGQPTPHPTHRYMVGLLVHQCPGVTEPTGPIEYARQQQTEREQQPAQPTAATITDNVQVHEELREARAAADRYFHNGLKAVGAAQWRAHDAEQRAKQAEAAIARVSAYADRLDQLAEATIRAADRSLYHGIATDIRARLDESKEPRP